MKKLVIACALTSMFVLSASANASEFTINPMVGASNSKAMGTKAAIGLEAGYSDFVFGYTYSGAEKGQNINTSFETDVMPGAPDVEMIQVSGSERNDYKAHTLYLGYQFDMGAGHLAVKAGAEFSKLKSVGQYELNNATPGQEGFEQAELNLNADSNTVVKPMIGVGYYMDNGLNFNLHYTFHSGGRDMKGTGSVLHTGGLDAGAVSYSVEDKDFSTVMFTVGYRF
ncbi:hypothetical protein FM038_016375 [Shewanella eurypsychrophilus]|uniref:Outer membrane protein beta-barrel domain-containing protein n=1 Tax=Shewanella eurypsychrophilus TaxID=2593656 RepID=A0ABX6V8Y9_9GAMM|nr:MULTISPECIES: hypothetical protein [Shewanella]QFU23595.1 hypothetical protein FS418_18175 [Shewanella sp. YLB-09]QPG58819.1 hypothetical protein FM038_016375 [Shewanella eurypsychrophilus]